MNSTDNDQKHGEPHGLETDLKAAADAIKEAQRDFAHGDDCAGEAALHGAEEDLKHAERDRPREITVKVDGKDKRVRAGTYLVSEFKAIVGVAADRELDIVEHDTFKPLKDDKEIHVHECEVFVSHVRTGGSS
jgi:hypothetical protein